MTEAQHEAFTTASRGSVWGSALQHLTAHGLMTTAAPFHSHTLARARVRWEKKTSLPGEATAAGGWLANGGSTGTGRRPPINHARGSWPAMDTCLNLCPTRHPSPPRTLLCSSSCCRDKAHDRTHAAVNDGSRGVLLYLATVGPRVCRKLWLCYCFVLFCVLLRISNCAWCQ